MTRVLSLLAVCCATRAIGAQNRPAPLTEPAFAVAVLTEAITLARRTAYPDSAAAVCIGSSMGGVEAGDDVIALLGQGDSSAFRPLASCERAPGDSPTHRWGWLVDTVSGKPAVTVGASAPRMTPAGEFTVTLHYYQHGTSAAEWTCTGRRDGARWQILDCRMTHLS